MAETFEIKVPITFKKLDSGDTSSRGGGSKSSEDSMQKLVTSITAGISIEKILADALSGVYDLLQPIVRLLSVLFLLIFLPLMPIIIKISNFLADFIKRMADAGGGLQGLFKTIFSKETFAGLIKLIWGIIVDLFKGLTSFIVGMTVDWITSFGKLLLGVGEAIVGILLIVWNKTVIPAFKLIGDGAMYIWNKILLPAWNFFIGIGQWIWVNILYPAFNFLKDIGTWIWNILKAPFVWIADKIMSFLGGGGKGKSGQDFILRPNGQFIETSPSDTIFAMKDPSKLLGGGGGSVINININEPSFKQKQDMTELVNLISKELSQKMRRRVA